MSELLQTFDRRNRDVLELVRDDVAAPAQLFDRRHIVIRGHDLLVGNLSGRRALLRIERDDVVAHALGVEREHAAELTAADHADRLDRVGAHSGVLDFAAACIFATCAASRVANAASFSAMMRAASSAALIAPPIAIVATGTPGGIC